MSINGHSSEAVGTDPELTRTDSDPAARVGGVSVKEAAAQLAMPVSTMYDWVNRRWVRTIVGLSERGKEQRLVPWTEIERLQGGAREQLLQQSGRKLDSGSESDPINSESETTGTDSLPTGSGSETTATCTLFRSEPIGVDWKGVAKAEARRVRDLTHQLRKAERRAEKAEARAEQEGREMRVLLAQSVAAQQATARELEELRLKALPPAPAPKRVRGFKPWTWGRRS